MIKTIDLFRYAATAIVAFPAMTHPGVAAPCVLSPVTTRYNTIFAGAYRLEFDQHDPPGPHPDRWLADAGFRIVRPNRKICLVSPDVAIVILPMYIAAGHYLYIDTYSGGEDILFVVNARNCATVWRSPDWHGRGFGRTKTGYYLPGVGQMTIKHNCLPGKIVGRKKKS